MSPVTFFVAGTVVPQGSKTGYVVGRRAVLVDANAKALKPWRAEVARIARLSWAGRPVLAGAVHVRLIFVFERPKSVSRRLPFVKPDLDKLVRSILDSLTTADVWEDDSRVTSLVVEKVYGAAPGVHVTVEEVPVDGLTSGERWIKEWRL